MNRGAITIVLINLLAIMWAGSAFAQDATQAAKVAENCNLPSGSLFNALVPYNACVKDAALKFEPSKGSPSDIYEAATVECASTYAEVTRIADACSRFYSIIQMEWNGKAIIDSNTKSTVTHIVLAKRAAQAAGN